MSLTCLMLANRWAMLGAVIFGSSRQSDSGQFGSYVCVLVHLLHVIMHINTRGSHMRPECVR